MCLRYWLNVALISIGGKSGEAAMSRHSTAENAAQREFQKNFSTFTLKIRF